MNQRTQEKSSIVIIALLLISNFTAQAQASSLTDTIAPDKIVVYKTVNGTDLSLHVFNPEKHKVSARVPTIVFFFGGGWTGGSPKQFYEQAQYFAKRGMVAISAEYRIAKTHGTTPFDAVTDAKSTIRWVRKHAKNLGIDSNQIVASGGSAGGHIAACTALIEGYEAVDEDMSISSKPNAMVLYNPVLDTTEEGYGLTKVGEKRKTDISPNHHIKSGIVSTLVFHGKADTTVPFENAERFKRLMERAGNDCELEAYEGKGHGFFNGPYLRGEKAEEALYTDVVEKSYAFLASRLPG